MVVNRTQRPRPTGEDLLRALGYGALALWSIVFLIYPPVAFQTALAGFTLTFWHGIALAGSVAALLGSLTRIDLKLEYPGIIILLIGPVFYTLSQVYYIAFNIEPGSTSRYALAVYAIVPAILLTPRLFGLYSETRRAKAAHSSALRTGRRNTETNLLFVQDLEGRQKP